MVDDDHSVKRIKRHLSENPFDALPETLLVEILIRLPCKSCFKFKCVSKQWLSIISQPYFIRQFIWLRESKAFDYTATSSRRIPPIMLYSGRLLSKKVEGIKPITSIPDPHSPKKLPFRVFAACNDLLLCCTTWGEYSAVLLCVQPDNNCQLPKPPKEHDESARMGLVSSPLYRCDKAREDIVVDLNLNTSFKVVRFLAGLRVLVFSSETGRWMELSIVLPQGFSDQWRCRGPTKIAGNNGMLYNTGGYPVLQSAWFMIQRWIVFVSSEGRRRFRNRKALLRMPEHSKDDFEYPFGHQI